MDPVWTSPPGAPVAPVVGQGVAPVVDPDAVPEPAPGIGAAPGPPVAGSTDPAEPEPDLDLAAVAAELTEVEAALERLDAGTYGICATCDAPLGDDVLTVDPAARSCEAHLRL